MSAAIEDNIFKLVHNLDMGRGLSKRLKQTQIGGTIITRTPQKCLDPCNGDDTILCVSFLSIKSRTKMQSQTDGQPANFYSSWCNIYTSS